MVEVEAEEVAAAEAVLMARPHRWTCGCVWRASCDSRLWDGRKKTTGSPFTQTTGSRFAACLTTKLLLITADD